MATLDTVLAPAADHCVRELGGETIFLSEAGDRIHVLDETGGFIWRALDGRRSLAEILDVVCAEFDVVRDVARDDLLRFADELVANRLAWPAGATS